MEQNETLSNQLKEFFSSFDLILHDKKVMTQEIHTVGQIEQVQIDDEYVRFEFQSRNGQTFKIKVKKG